MTDTCSVCGLPTAAHFTPETKRKLSCEQLRFVLALHPNQFVAFYEGTATRHGVIAAISRDGYHVLVIVPESVAGWFTLVPCERLVVPITAPPSERIH